MRAAFQAFQAFREAITPALKESQFLEGRLTPGEFVQSGDALVRGYPSFRWMQGRPEYAKSCLPADKQCLVMYNVASRARVADIKKGAEDTVMDEEGDWTAASAVADSKSQMGSVAVVTVPNINTSVPLALADTAEDEYSDLDAYIDPSVCATAAADTGIYRDFAASPEMRLYDLYITYDTYYACPRAYLTGKHSGGSLLNPDEMMEDIMQDYVDKTATMERHPYMPDTLTVSIHPCRHAQTMKRILGGMSVGTGAVVTLTVESYMPAFLKMLASMVPTLEYDYTAAVRL